MELLKVQDADKVTFDADTKASVNLYKDGVLFASIPTQDAFYRLEQNDAWLLFVERNKVEWKGGN